MKNLTIKNILKLCLFFESFALLPLMATDSNEFSLTSNNYVLEIPTEIIALSNSSSCLGVTENDKILISYEVPDGRKYAYWNKNQSLLELRNIGITPGKLCKNGTILGYYTEQNSTQQNITTWKAIWNPITGVQKIDLRNDIPNFKYDHYSNSVHLKDINSSEQLVGNYTTKDEKKRIFIWENGKARDFNLDEEIYTLGYDVIDIYVEQINDNGNIIGCFSYGYKHPLKNKWINEGIIKFFWNGQIYLLNFGMNYQIYQMNNNDEILVGKFFNNTEFFKWHFKNGFELLISNGHVYSTTFNDSSNFIFVEESIDEKDNSFKVNYFLSLDKNNIFNLCDELRDMNINFNENLFLSNNGMIFGQCSIWGENHVFRLRPIKK